MVTLPIQRWMTRSFFFTSADPPLGLVIQYPMKGVTRRRTTVINPKIPWVLERWYPWVTEIITTASIRAATAPMLPILPKDLWVFNHHFFFFPYREIIIPLKMRRNDTPIRIACIGQRIE